MNCINFFYPAYGLSSYDLALSENEKALSLTAVNDFRHQALAHYGVGLANFRTADLRMKRADLAIDDPQTILLFTSARESFVMCITLGEADHAKAEAEEGRLDWFLQRIKNQQCTEMRELSQQRLELLQGSDEV